jgi:hypothetical protein
VQPAAIAALMGGDALGAMECLDGAGGDAQVDLGADQRVRHRVVEAVDLDVVVEPNAGEPPLGELVIALWQRSQRRPLNAGEQIAPAQAEAPHDVAVHAFEHLRNRAIGFGK